MMNTRNYTMIASGESDHSFVSNNTHLKPSAENPILIQNDYNLNKERTKNAESGDHEMTDVSNMKLVKHQRNNLYFEDEERCIDFVLVWRITGNEEHDNVNKHRRIIFEKNLEEEGLELEYDRNNEGRVQFVKIHTPYEVLCRYAEILKFRLPMKKSIEDDQEDMLLYEQSGADKEFGEEIPRALNYYCERFVQYCTKVFHNDDIFPPKDKYYTAIYSRDKEYFLRSRIVDFILQRKRFTDYENDTTNVGIQKLIADGAYIAAYPLHEGNCEDDNTRGKLYQEWASLRKFYKYQPLDYIKDYFGVKVALYFAWLGFYTYMLIPASLIGLICFLYGYLTFQVNNLSQEVCKNQHDIIMCPLCDHFCNFWELEDSCLYAQIGTIIDTPATVFFSIFMSFWAATFLELWKRYSAKIAHRWDLTGFDIKEEHPRPAYLIHLKNVEAQRMNYVTKTLEPKVPFWTLKLPGTLMSASCVLFLICVPREQIFPYNLKTVWKVCIILAMVAVIGVILYRMSLLAALSFYSSHSLVTSNAMLITSVTAACINLICIMIFNLLYTRLATWLTEKELHRTQTQHEESLSFKIYLLQFVNNYASIFYIAFFKGRFIGFPGNYIRFFGYRQEECGPGGCLVELCIQLAIIFMGKQIINTFIEMLIPMFLKFFNTYIFKKLMALVPPNDVETKPKKRWVHDFKLVEWSAESLFYEYLEIVLQFGFVTIFVAAFPLAPLFAFLNNIFETRLDAKKLLTFYRRPVSQRVSDIGIWFNILDGIGKLAVLSNAFIIAFSSDFIPRLVYQFTVSENYTLTGFLNYTLSIFNVSDFPVDKSPHFNFNDTIELCRYQDFREPPWSVDKYKRSDIYWHVLAARLSFVVVFENVVVFIMMMIKWCIPDMSSELRDQIHREAFITNEMILEQELKRAREDASRHQNNGGI